MEKNSKIYIAGHRGMVGSAIHRKLQKEDFSNIIAKTSKELDLRNQAQVNTFFETEKPEYVFLAAAKVGGIVANNTYRAEFMYDNLMIQSNVIHQSYINGVKKLLFLGSSCIYPRMAPQPIKEEYLLTGLLEHTNESYAIAKIAGLKMCEAYRNHVLPALLRRFHEAKETGAASVTLWGTGTPLREFLHADDLADACYFLMNNYDKPDPVNIGVGKDISIKELAELIKNITGFTGAINWDTSKPDGTPRKLLDVTRINEAGWKASISLQEGIEQVYKDVF